PVILVMLAVGTATPSMSTCVFAVVPKPAPVSVTVLPPAVPPEDGLMPASAGRLVSEKETEAGVVPVALAATVYGPPAVLFAAAPVDNKCSGGESGGGALKAVELTSGGRQHVTECA